MLSPCPTGRDGAAVPDASQYDTRESHVDAPPNAGNRRTPWSGCRPESDHIAAIHATRPAAKPGGFASSVCAAIAS
jgi:hypothetical protein